MANDIRNITAAIEAYDFRVTFNIPTLSADKQQVLISYNGFASPILTAALTTYEYSMDNGTTWSAMTASGDTTLTGLAFTVAGASLMFKWQAKTDIGTNLYNRQIRIRLRATSGAIVSDYSMYTLFFERLSTNVAADAESNNPFPEDYSGVPGNELLNNAPKTN